MPQLSLLSGAKRCTRCHIALPYHIEPRLRFCTLPPIASGSPQLLGDRTPAFHSSRHTRIARPGIKSCSLLRPPHFAFPKSQSVNVTTLLVLSAPLFSSACSMVWLAMRPLPSKVKMKSPLKSSPFLRLNIGLSPPSSVLSPRLILPPSVVVELAAAFASGDDVALWSWDVFHRTTNFSALRSCSSSVASGGMAYAKPVLTIFSDRIFNLTLPTMGTQPQATGVVQREAR